MPNKRKANTKKIQFSKTSLGSSQNFFERLLKIPPREKVKQPSAKRVTISSQITGRSSSLETGRSRQFSQQSGGGSRNLKAGSSRQFSQLRLPPKRLLQNRWTAADVAVMMALWSTGVLATVFETCRSRAIELFLREKQIEQIAFWSRIVFACSFLLMWIVAFVTSWLHTIKYWTFFGGMVLFASTSVTGYALSSIRLWHLAVLLNSIGGLWHVFHPLRYSLVFHQRFPIPWTYSRKIVTVNTILIWIAAYTCHFWVVEQPYMSDEAFRNGWIFFLSVALIWLVALLCMRGFRNRTPEKLEVIRKIYQKTELLARDLRSFEMKQSSRNIILVLLILYPGAIFTLLLTLSEQSLKLIAQRSLEVQSFLTYRIDLIIAVLVAVLIEFVPYLGPTSKGELFELAIITIAFILKIILMIAMIRVLQDTAILPVTGPPNGWVAETSICKVLLFGMAKQGESLIVQIDGFVFFGEFCEEDLLLCAKVPVRHSKKATLKIAVVPSGEMVHESQIELVQNSIFIFHYHNKVNKHDGKWIKAGWTDSFNASQSAPQVMMLNTHPECNDFDEESVAALNKSGFVWDDSTVGYQTFCSICMPFRWTIRTTLKGKEVSSKHMRPSRGPFMNSEPFSTPCTPSLDELGEMVCEEDTEVEAGNSEYQVHALRNLELPYRPYWRQRIQLRPERMHFLIPLDKPKLDADLRCFTIRLVNFTRTPAVFSVDVDSVSTIAVLALNRVPHIMVAVSYVHFMWMQLPINWRTLIIYGYCTLDTLAEWTPRFFMMEITINDESMKRLILVIACLMAWHVAVSLVWERESRIE